MSSILFRINDYFLGEYIYTSDTLEYDTNTHGFLRVSNSYDNTDTIINKSNAKFITKNVKDKTVVDTGNNKYVLLDEDGSYLYDLYDANIDISDVNFPINLQVKYDKLRIHIISGYNFPETSGIIISVDWRMKNNNRIKILDSAYINLDSELIYFNPKPVFISGIVFDKYIEYQIPSFAWSLDNQEQNPGSDTFASIITKNIGLVNQDSLYVELKEILSTEIIDGFTSLNIQNNYRYSIKSKDVYDFLSAVIRESDNGDYFEYFGQWDNGSIEDYIFGLNSLSGNDYYIIHQLTLLEQIGESFIQTDNLTVNQTDDYDLPKIWIPVIKNDSLAVSFSIEYNLRLYNRANGTSIIKFSSISSFDVKKYGRNRIKLNIGTNNRPLNVVNKIVTNDNIAIVPNNQVLVKTKNIVQLVNSNDIWVSFGDDNSNNILNQSELSLLIDPFDNLLKFNIYKNDNDSFVPFDLSDGAYQMAFIKNDNSFFFVDEYKDVTFNKSSGELLFLISNESYDEIKNFNNKKFFIVKINNANRAKLISGGWELDI